MAYPSSLFMNMSIGLSNLLNYGLIPKIITQPLTQTVDEFSTVTFNVVASGGSPLTYTWRKNGVIVGTNSASYIITVTAATDNAAVITCTVSNSAGSVVSSNAVLTIQRNFVTFDPVLQTHMTMQTAKAFAGDYEFKLNLHVTDLTIITTASMLLGTVGSTNNSMWLTSAGSLVIRDDTGLTITVSSVITINKLHSIRFTKVGGNIQCFVNGVAVSTPAAFGAFSVGRIGVRQTSEFFFRGVIANVTLTDLTTPSNSESWKLDRPIGTNTEQSSSGNNLLTYVNATKREKFTRVGNDWLGVEVVVNGGFDNGLVGWSVTATAPNNVTVVAGKLRIECIDGGFTGASQTLPLYSYKITGSVTSSGGQVGLQYTNSQTLTFPLGGSIINAIVTADRILPKRDAISVGIWDNLSAKRILEIA